MNEQQEHQIEFKFDWSKAKFALFRGARWRVVNLTNDNFRPIRLAHGNYFVTTHVDARPDPEELWRQKMDWAKKNIVPQLDRVLVNETGESFIVHVLNFTSTVDNLYSISVQDKDFNEYAIEHVTLMPRAKKVEDVYEVKLVGGYFWGFKNGEKQTKLFQIVWSDAFKLFQAQTLDNNNLTVSFSAQSARQIADELDDAQQRFENIKRGANKDELC